ncbi:hypothetical protein MP638_005126, partial [Amoeboaphelidium occidentale]
MDSGSVIQRYSPEISYLNLKLTLNENSIFYGTSDGFLRKIDSTTNQMTSLAKFAQQVNCIVVYRQFVFVCLNDSPFLRKIDARTGAIARNLEGHQGYTYAAAVISNLLYSSGIDDRLLEWNADTGRSIRSFGIGERPPLRLYAHEGILYGIDATYAITRWSITTGQLFQFRQLSGRSIAFSLAFYQQLVFMKTERLVIKGFDTESENERITIRIKGNVLNALSIWKNFIFSAGSSSIITGWNKDVFNLHPFVFVTTDAFVIHCTFVKDDYIFTGGTSTRAHKWSLPDFQLLITFEGHGDTINDIIVDSTNVFTAGSDRMIIQFELSSGAIVFQWNGHMGSVNSVAVANSLLFSGSDDTNLRIWDLSSQRIFRRVEYEIPVLNILVLEEKLLLAFHNGLGMIQISTLETLVNVKEIITCPALAVDEELVYSGCSNFLIGVRDIVTLEVNFYLSGHLERVTSVVLDQEKILFSAGLDGSVKRWNVTAKQVAFSFEDTRSRVSSLIEENDKLFIGLGSGAINVFKTNNGALENQIIIHGSLVSSIIIQESSIYSSGFDGLIVNHLPQDLNDYAVVYQNRSQSFSSLLSILGHLLFIADQREVLSVALNGGPSAIPAFKSVSPIISLAASQSLVFAGSQSGVIFAWSISSGALEFEMKQHTSTVNDLLISADQIFSASDDGSIIEWFMRTGTFIRAFKRVSSSSLGHVGPVLSITVCSGLLFSGGSDTTSRRWNLTSSLHEDVYFGPKKAVTTVYCNNQTLFCGSDDFSVYMYKPIEIFNFPVATGTSTSIQALHTSLSQDTRRIQTLGGNSNPAEFDSTLLIIIGASSILLLAALVFCRLQIKSWRSNNVAKSATDSHRETSYIVTDMKTMVNTSMGISKHASLEIPPQSVAVVKKLTSGGGGDVFLARLMEPVLAKRHGVNVIQKRVFLRNKLFEEAFFQEIGIMVMLSTFPNFCQIIGYTMNPYAMILKFYADGALSDWIANRQLGFNTILMIFLEVGRGLQTMHNHFLAHCDIKPQNILMEIRNGKPYCAITDFGITQVLSHAIVASKVFNVVNLRGLSVQYAAPEAFKYFRDRDYRKADFKIQYFKNSLEPQLWPLKKPTDGSGCRRKFHQAFLSQHRHQLSMKLQDILKCLLPAMISLLVTSLEHEKSFMMQESASVVWSIAFHGESLLLTSSNDIVQKDIHTGAIQRTFRAHTKPIYSFIVTEDLKMISSAYDDMLIVWSLETGSILKRIWLRSSETFTRSVYFQDAQVFTGGLDGKVRQFDLASGKLARTISITGEVYCIIAAEDSLFVGKDLLPYGLKLSVRTGTVIFSLNGHIAGIYSLYLFDNFLFSGSVDTDVICWSALSGELVQSYSGHLGMVYAVAVFDGELYSATDFKELFKWNITEGSITTKFFVVDTGEMRCMAFKSRTLFTGSLDTTVFRWNSVSGELLFRYTGRNSKIRSIVSWKNFIISGGEDSEIRMWDASTDSIDPSFVIDNNRSIITSLYLFDDNLYSGDYRGDIWQIQMLNFSLFKTFTTLGESVYTLTASMDFLYAGGGYGYIYQWNLSSGVQTATFLANVAPISSIQLINDILYSGSFEGTLKSWNTKTFAIIGYYSASHQINAMLVEQDYFIACTQRSIESFSLIFGYNSAIAEGHLDAVTSLCFEEALILYSAGNDGTIKKWNFVSRSVAFSFEKKNEQVYSLAVYNQQLFVGLKSGRIDCYNTDNALVLKSLWHHHKTVSSLVTLNGSIYSSSFDGNVLKFSSAGDGNFVTIYKSDPEPLNDFSLGRSFWIALQHDAKIVLGPMSLSSESVKVIDYQTPLVCIAATESEILAGSKSGIIYAWSVETLQEAFELKGHVSPVNSLLVTDVRLFSASDDKTIIEWSLNSKTRGQTFQRLSNAALGHLGPVNSLSYCSDTLFSAGSENTVRRWNTQTGKHEDVYFGFTKSVTSVVCYNGSVFAGSEGFSVLMFNPSLPQNQDVTAKPTTSVARRNPNQRRIVKLQKAEGAAIDFTQVLVAVSIVLAVIILVILGYVFLKKRPKNITSPPATITLFQGTESTQTIPDLKTVVNS